jgi:hypothetical protein
VRGGLARLDEVPVYRQFRGLPDILDRFGVTGAGRKAVADVHDLSREMLGPFYHSLTQAMYPELRREVTGGGPAIVALCGRDSLGSSASLAGAEPDFHRQYCRDIGMSRITAALAYRDGRQRGRILPGDEREMAWQESVFSKYAEDQDAAGAFGHMEHYLLRRDLPLERGTIVVHDFACASGTTQEFLRAAFPRTNVVGRYATTWLSADDPHRDEKHGFLWHGDAITYPDGVPDRDCTHVSFACWIPENMLSDPWGTAVDIRADGPVQMLDDSNRANRSFPVRFDPELFGTYRDWNIWAAGKTAALLAVHAYAKDHAGREPDWDFSLLRQGRDPLSQAMRGWTFPASGDPVEPRARVIFDAYVPRRALGPNETTKPVFAEPLKSSETYAAPLDATRNIARTLRPIARTMPGAASRTSDRAAYSPVYPAPGITARDKSRSPAMASSLNKSK